MDRFNNVSFIHVFLEFRILNDFHLLWKFLKTDDFTNNNFHKRSFLYTA